MSLLGGITIYEYFLDLLKGYTTGYWYIQAVFVCVIITIVVSRVFNDSWIAYLAVLAIGMLIPNCMLWSGVLTNILFIYPYFVAGYLIKKHDIDTIFLAERFGKK